jgi:lauroyl/myristoyl acyltransferase
MTLQQKFNEYIASGDITISDEQRDWILPFIERCVGEERESIKKAMEKSFAKTWMERFGFQVILWKKDGIETAISVHNFFTQEDKIK